VSQLIFHLIGSAHIDPVWLWDYREGLNEGLITCRSILDLMDEDKDVTFIRGEALIYDHIEQADPEMFERIKKHIATGRWDVVGGTYIQADENLPATETLLRNYTRGQQYFTAKFGKPVEVGWSADCFGHTAGLPMILNAAGLKQFAFTRPLKPECALPGTAFWWHGPGESKVLTVRPLCDWYCIERTGMVPRLEQTLREAPQEKTKNQVVLYGLGNHGGGPTRKHLAEIREWAKKHPEIKFVFSTWTKYFRDLQAEIATHPADYIPSFRGEIGYTERGCYTNLAKLKFMYHKAVNAVQQAEATDAIISAKLARKPADLSAPWDSVIFNSFHDILPGTCIERAADMQMAHLGEAIRGADLAEFKAVTALAMQIDTRVDKPAEADMPGPVSMILWNPQPFDFDGYMELESSLDWRPIWKYVHRPTEVPFCVRDSAGKSLPFQPIDAESSFSHPVVPWRKRVIAPVKIPAMGWTMVQMAYVPEDQSPARPTPPQSRAFYSGDAIENGIFKIDTYVGAPGVRIRRNGKLFIEGDGLSAAIFDDPWGSWGKPEWDEQKEATPILNHKLKVSEVKVLETGPYRASLFVRLAGKKSRLDLTIRLYADRDEVEVLARVFFDERLGRMKLLFPVGDRAEYDVPGATVTRGPLGEVPANRWVRVPREGRDGFAFISDSLTGFDASDGVLRATVVRSGRYAFNPKIVEDKSWQPASDSGELKFKFSLTPGTADLPRLAKRLEQQPTYLAVPAKPGPLPRQGSLASIETDGVKLLALKPAADGGGLILRLQESAGRRVAPKVTILGQSITLNEIQAGEIATWSLAGRPAAMAAKRCTVGEI